MLCVFVLFVLKCGQMTTVPPVDVPNPQNKYSTVLRTRTSTVGVMFTRVEGEGSFFASLLVPVLFLEVKALFKFSTSSTSTYSSTSTIEEDFSCYCTCASTIVTCQMFDVSNRIFPVSSCRQQNMLAFWVVTCHQCIVLLACQVSF